MWDRTSLDYQHASDFKDGHVFAQSFPSFILVWLSLSSSTCCNYEATWAKVVACKKGSASPKALDIESVTSLSGWLFDSKSRSLFLCQVHINVLASGTKCCNKERFHSTSEWVKLCLTSGHGTSRRQEHQKRMRVWIWGRTILFTLFPSHIFIRSFTSSEVSLTILS